MKSEGPIRDVLVVGGGTAGWMSAIYLNRMLRGSGVTVRLVESPAVGLVGVGESTVPTLIRFLRQLDISEDAFMRGVQGTYKLGIRFESWVRPGHVYWHPFGMCGGFLNGLDLFHYWLARRLKDRSERPYHSYSLQAQLGDVNKAARPFSGTSPVVDRGAYAYQLDATVMGAWLKTLAVPQGVSALTAHVTKVMRDPTGAVDHLVTSEGIRLKADLYVDCTGFQGLLIEKELEDPWISWSNMLLCDRAVAAPIPSEKEIRSYTRSTALDAGWLWEIPLAHRIGAGYVFSSAHLDETAAFDEFERRRPATGTPVKEPWLIKMRTGRRTHCWVKNVVAVGLASGFIEPLESTSIFLIQHSLEQLVQLFPDRTFAEPLRRAYNEEMRTVFEGARDFIILHYLVNKRHGEKFWDDARNVPLPDSLAQAIELYRENGTVSGLMNTIVPETSLHQIFAGGEMYPRRPHVQAQATDPTWVQEVFDDIDRQNREWVAKLPGHRELIESMRIRAGEAAADRV